MREFKLDAAIVGAQKCGTSTLFDTLAMHPDVAGSRPKEPHFFSRTEDWRAHLSDYRQLFEGWENRLTLEASTTYTFAPRLATKLWESLYAHNPQMKIIYIVRHPASRIVSAFMHRYERGFTDETDMWTDVTTQIATLANTRYATQIIPYIQTFGRAQVHICFFEDLVDKPAELLDGVARFLEIDPDQLSKKPPHSNNSFSSVKRHRRFDNPGLGTRLAKKLSYRLWARITDNTQRAFTEKPRFSAAQRAALLQYLSLEIDELERLTARDLSDWRV